MSTLVLFAPSVSAVSFTVDSNTDWSQGTAENLSTGDNLKLSLGGTDGNNEVLVNNNGQIVLHDVVSGETVNIASADSFAKAGDIADIDGDGDKDIVYEDASNNLVIYDLGSNTKSSYSLAIDGLGDAVDHDSDGNIEILYSDGDFKSFEPSSESITTLYSDSSSIDSVGYASDYEDDGDLDVLIGISGSFPELIRYDFGSESGIVEDSPNELGSVGPIIDINGDSTKEFVTSGTLGADPDKQIGEAQQLDGSLGVDVPFVDDQGNLAYYDVSSDSETSTSVGVASYGGPGGIADIDYHQTASYTSDTYSPTNKAVLNNVTVSSLSRPSSSEVEVTVQTSNDGFSSIAESQTITNADLVDGTNTYQLDGITSKAESFRFKVSYQRGSTPSIDAIEIQGTENTVPTVNSVGFDPSNPGFGDSVNAISDVTDEDGVSEVRFTVWERGTKIIDNQTGTDLGSGDWESPGFTVDEGPGYYNATVSYVEDTTGKSTTDSPESSFYIDNEKPTVDNVEFSDSNPSFEDTVFSNASVSDGNGVDEVRFTVWEQGTKIVDNQTGSQAASGYWHSPSFTVDEGPGYYNTTVTYVEDSTGRVSTSSPETSFYFDNAKPSVDSVSFNDSNPEYEDSVYPQSTVSDEDGVSEVRFTVWEGDALIVDNETGTEVSQGSWRGPSVQVDETNVYYNTSVSYIQDSTGRTSTSSPMTSFYISNSVPGISSTTLSENRKTDSVNLSFGIDDKGESDIASFTGTGTVLEFTNTSLKLGKSLPVNSDFTVTDAKEASVTRYVNLSRNFSTLQQDSDFSHDYQTQQVVKSVTWWNFGGSAVDLDFEFENYGSVVSGESWSTTLQDTTSTHEAVWSGDYTQETLYNASVSNATVDITQPYTATAPVEVLNSQSVQFTDLDISGFVSPPTGSCSQVNNSAVDVDANTQTNFSVGFQCDAGSEGSPNQEIVNVTSNKQRIWYNTTVNVDSNFTEHKPIIWPVNKDNLRNPDIRDAGSLEGYADGNQVDIEVLDSSGFLKLRVGTDHGNSSWDAGSHSASITYTVTESSDSGGGSGGGGTIIDDGDDTATEPNLLFTPTAFEAGYGRTVTRTMKIENYFNDNITTSLSIPTASEEPDCSYFEVQNQKGVGLRPVQSTGKTGEYTIGPAAAGVTGAFEDLRVNVEVSMPEKGFFESRASKTLTCPVNVDAEKVRAEELVLQAKPVPSTSLPIPNLQLPEFDLFQNVCTNVERNTAENPEELECPEEDQFSVNAPPLLVAGGVAAALLSGILGIMYVYFRPLLKALWPF